MLPIIARYHTFVMATYFESLLLCIRSIHIKGHKGSSNLFTKGFGGDFFANLSYVTVNMCNQRICVRIP